MKNSTNVMSAQAVRSFIFFLILLGPAACPALLRAESTDPQSSEVPSKTKLGIITTLSGPAAGYGLDIRDSLLFALEKLGHGRYDYLLEDDKCDGKEAVSAAHKLIDIEKVQYILGLGCSGAALAAAPLFEKAKIPTLVILASSPKISASGDYIFRTTPSDKAAAGLLHAYISAGHKRLGVLSEETEYAQDFKNLFVDANKRGELYLVAIDYLSSVKDFRSLLLKLKTSNIDALLINPQNEENFAAMLAQQKELHLDVPVYGAYFPVSSTLISIAKNNIEGAVAVDTPDPGTALSEEGKKLFAEYEQKYGPLRSIQSTFLSAFEAVRSLTQAIESGQDVRSFLYHTKFQGVFGPYSFDENGDILGLRFSIKSVRDGKVVNVPFAPATRDS